jgi:hypothetical protein
MLFQSDYAWLGIKWVFAWLGIKLGQERGPGNLISTFSFPKKEFFMVFLAN